MMKLALLISVALAAPPTCQETAATLSHWGTPLSRRLRTKSFRLSKTSSRKHDGVGQQALGAISCMVLARLEPAAYCYVNDPARPYAGNTYPCQLGDSWWWSPGFGRDDCPEGGFFRRPAPRGDGDGVRTVR